MSRFLLTIFLTLLAYFFVLSRKNKLAFKKEKIQINNGLAILITLFIITTHIKIMWERKTDIKFVLFVITQLLLRYDIALAILVTIVDFYLEKNNVPAKNYHYSYKEIPNIQSDFTNELENVCFA